MGYQEPTICQPTEEGLHKYCLRCGRLLKNVDARRKGYGAVCEKKIKHESRSKLF